MMTVLTVSLINGKEICYEIAKESSGNQSIFDTISFEEADFSEQLTAFENSKTFQDLSSTDHGVYKQRNLQTATNSSMSTITGDGVVSHRPFSTHIVTAIAKDSNGDEVYTGGDPFYIIIQNEGAFDDNFNFNEVPGATNTISSTIFEKMTDHGNGTYSYSYSVNSEGKLTIAVILYYTESVKVDFYENVDLLGSPSDSFFVNNIHHIWGYGLVFDRKADYVS
jgi:hypothetical protein